MTTSNNANEIRKEVKVGPITVDSVQSGQFDKPGMIQAQLRQVINTKSFYPSARIANSLSGNLFDKSEFKSLTEKDFDSSETRVTWIPVPEGTSKEEVEARLAKAPAAAIYRILSNKPILSDAQDAAIAAGLKTLADFARTQAVRYPEKSKNAAGDDTSGLLILDPNGKIQYKSNHFAPQGAEDRDLRTAEPTDFWVSEEMVEELEAVMSAVA